MGTVLADWDDVDGGADRGSGSGRRAISHPLVDVIGEGFSTSSNWRVRHRPPLLGEVLVANERATPDDVRRALRVQRQRAHQPIGEIMVSLGLISRIDLDVALDAQRSETGTVTVVLDEHPDA